MPTEPNASRPRTDLTIVCAWCDELLAAGGPEVSHGLCDTCANAAAKRARDRRRELAS